ncbi:MAG TPA: hypothetical protein PLG27_04280, partial [Candidatus Latescibacteria bacterium]|nr:hypothetical protein [Candidatus Latescibacterota bacterium]
MAIGVLSTGGAQELRANATAKGVIRDMNMQSPGCTVAVRWRGLLRQALAAGYAAPGPRTKAVIPAQAGIQVCG